MTGRLTGLAEPALREAADADRSLRDLADRVASVERALRLAPAEARPPLAEAHGALVAQLDAGVAAYERLVVAAAGYVAEDARPGTDAPGRRPAHRGDRPAARGGRRPAELRGRRRRPVAAPPLSPAVPAGPVSRRGGDRDRAGPRRR